LIENEFVDVGGGVEVPGFPLPPVICTLALLHAIAIKINKAPRGKAHLFIPFNFSEIPQ
jgi:hypothetical protein